MWSPTPMRPSSPTAPPLSTDFTTQPQPSSSPFRVNPGVTWKKSVQQLKKFKLFACNLAWRKHGVKWRVGKSQAFQWFWGSFQMQVNFPETREICHTLLDFSGNIKTERCQKVLRALVGCNVWKPIRKVNSGPVYTMPEEFENGDSFLRLGIPSTLIRKRSSNRRKRRVTVFVWTENILKMELSRKRWRHIITWFPWPRFTQTPIQTQRWLLCF